MPMPSLLRNSKLLPLAFLCLIIGMIYYGMSRRQVGGLSAGGQLNIVTSLPATYSIATVLAQNTDIQVQYLSTSVSLSDQPEFFRQHEHLFAEKLKAAHAAITVRGVWLKDPLYYYARRARIKTIEIDAAGSYLPLHQRLHPITLSEGVVDVHIWQSFSGTEQMADNIAAELARVRPKARKSIQRNLADLKRQLTESRTEIFAQVKPESWTRVITVSPGFAHLIDGMNLLLVQHIAGEGWDESRLKSLGTALERYPKTVVIGAAQPNSDLQAVLDRHEARLLVLEPIESMPGGDVKYYFKALGRNHAMLIEALNPAPQ